MSENDKGSFDERINRARERMSTDYDASPPRRPAVPAGSAGGSVISQFLSSDTGTRRLVYGAAGLGGLLVLGIGGWALMGHHQSVIPVLGPPPVSMKTKPVDPGGMQVDGLSTPDADDGQAHPVPAPEKPNPGALAAQYGQQAAKTDATDGAAAGNPAAADQAKAPAAAPEGVAPAGDASAPAAPTAPGAAAQADAPQQPESLPDSSAGVADDSAAGDTAASVPAPAAPVPAKIPPKAVAKKTAPAEDADAARKPEESRPAASAAPASAPVPPAATGGKFRVQLAALQSEAQAQQEWSRLKTHYSTLFADRTPVIEKVQRDNAIFYRLRVGGFASVAETRSFCSAVRERGLGCTQVH
ncbi:SPOR domain-containing protein [Acetobacter persici]|uniref:SPOR domain-containing protein n=1 Tax=Acetobacter persici TaxID=1076596 RepID=UPI0039EAE549